MITIAISGETFRLLPFAPNTDAVVRFGLLSPAETKRRLTGGRISRPQAMRLRHSLEWSVDLRASDFALLRNGTQALQAEDVLVPLWPFATRANLELPFTGGHVISWKDDWSDFAIDTEAPEEWDYHAPLLRGFLTQAPSLRAQNDDLVTVDFSITEDAPVSFAIAPGDEVLPADETFETAGGYAAPVFPFLPHADVIPTPGVAVAEITRREIGPGRRRAVEFYPQTPELVHEASLRFPSAAYALELWEWWRRRAGTAGEHWVALSQTVGRLAVTATAGTDVLTFTEPVDVGNNAYLALYGPHGVMELARIDTVDGAEITLAANLAHDWSPSLTCVSHAILARHTNPELVIEFERAAVGWIASASIAWREVAPEYAPAEGETRGTTLGRLAPRAWFFKLELDYNGALRTWRFTNWESGATAAGHDWVYNACDFDKLIRDIDLESDKCTATFRYVAGGPWDNWLPGQLAARGSLTIYSANVAADGTFEDFTQEQRGEMAAPEIDGAIVRQRMNGANALFDRYGPQETISRPCRTHLFRPRCGLALADWKFNAEIAAIAGNVVTIETITRANGGGLPSGFGAAQWFALGWLETPVDGIPYRFSIIASAAISSGEIALTLDRALNIAGVVVGSEVVAVPGCDRFAPTCREKFDNYENYRGFEHVPAIAPTLVVDQRQFSQAKK